MGADVTATPLSVVTRRRMTIALTAANLTGALVVFLFGTYILPQQHGFAPSWVNNLAFAIYMPVSLTAGWWWGVRDAAELRSWVDSDRPPTPRERMLALRIPARLMTMHAALWGGALVVFAVLNAAVSGSWNAAWTLAVTIGLGGVMTSTIAYLLSEHLMRPTVRQALSYESLQQPELPGVRARLLLTWALGTGGPLLAIIGVGVLALGHSGFSLHRLAATAGFLAVAGVGVGAGSLVIAARSIAQPLASMRQAVERVREGDVEVEIPVDDSSEVGLLQAGFNQMVAGLRERERLQDLFGRHVGEDVARQALDGGVKLGGELREAAVLFVEIVGSTGMAEHRGPEEVVELLNRFFAVVVETVAEHGGWINKFEGDAALCIFGAPLELPDAAGCALAAGRTLRERLAEEVPELGVGIGLSAGEVVAGNVGAAQRYEYTVIGGPVNEAARLTEIAKARGGIVASATIVERSAAGEAASWQVDGSVELRGFATPTRLALPV